MAGLTADNNIPILKTSGGAGNSYSGVSTGASRMTSTSKVTSSTYSSSNSGAAAGGKEYFVKMGGGVSSALGSGSRVESSSPTLLSRQRLISDASQKQHEEAATIVTKVDQ